MQPTASIMKSESAHSLRWRSGTAPQSWWCRAAVRRCVQLLVLLAIGSASIPLRAGQLLLQFHQVPRSEVVLVPIDFTNLLQHEDVELHELAHVQAARATDGVPIAAQFVPSSASSAEGLLVLQLPGPPCQQVLLNFSGSPLEGKVPVEGAVKVAQCTIRYDPQAMAGFPSGLTFDATGKEFSDFRWNDRLHHAELGGYLLRNDRQATATLVGDGPLCTVVRTQGAYCREDGTQPPSRPHATYDWYYFHDVPLIYVTAKIEQQTPTRWNEVHFLELIFPGRDFMHWSGAAPEKSGELIGNNSSHRNSQWAALVDDRNAIGMFGDGCVLVHDGRGQYGTYLHAEGDRSWQPWEETQRRYSAWIWVGSADEPQQEVAAWQQKLPLVLPATLTTQGVRVAIEQASDKAQQLSGQEQAAQRWRVAVANRLEAIGSLKAIDDALQGKVPADWHVLEAGTLRLAVQAESDSLKLASLFDTRSSHEHLPAHPAALFRVTLRNADTQELRTVTADRHWQHVSVDSTVAGSMLLQWKSPQAAELGPLAITVRAVADAGSHAVRWHFQAKGQSGPWSLWQVTFPQLELVTPGDEPALLIPRGSGEQQTYVWNRTFSFEGAYPSGWTSMQFMAAYDRSTRRGLYWALHDPLGSTKTLSSSSAQSAGTVLLKAEMPVPNMGQVGNSFQLEGEATWQLFQGDWFDAAILYRDWVRSNARWYPLLSSDGRGDTPAWMRELCVWAQTGGTAAQCAEEVKRFAEFMGVPVGFHWYSWHKIPFDNDYPHYFPPQDDFAEGVRQLHESNVYVMPYINGRLWDTRDRGVEDGEFTERALAAASKQVSGQPFTETYGSKEQDGSPVQLAVMCPATDTWQNEVNSIVARLFQEYQVDGVYIDQIAAAAPVTCMDSTHGHPLGGGHWWNEGYWQMLEQMRSSMPPDRMLTTECNGEPFVKWFDGYLTWHWQYDGQVPAFPAVYGGAIQMFGRAYRGGATADLALRMKSAQQLVYGEQIGWISPAVVNQPDSAAFLRQVVRLRWQLRRYFFAGEMLRPPVLQGVTARVRADWQWQDPWWVETDGVLTGCWQLPREGTTVAIFANVTDQPQKGKWSFDAPAAGITAPHVQVTRVTADGADDATTGPASFQREMEIPPRTVWAWEIAVRADAQ